jgi:hypothetical protein
MTILPINLYNGLPINCIDNNLISILKTKDKRFEEIATTLDINYYNILKSDDWSTFPECHQHRYYQMGWNLLGVSLKSPNLASYFNIIQLDTVPSDSDIIQVIKQYLNEGYYLFVILDRFYFPDGYDSGKRHFLHPAFIYGYDDRSGKLLMIEDCINILKYEKYEMSYNDVLKCVHYDSNELIKGYKLKSAPIQFSVDVNNVIKSCKTLIEEDIDYSNVESLGHIIKRGLSTISDSLEVIEIELPKVDTTICFNNLALLNIIKTPKLLQERNLLRNMLLHKKTLITTSEATYFHSIYSEMDNKIEIYRNFIMTYFYKRQLDPNYSIASQEIKHLKQTLKFIKENEEHTTYKLIETLENLK